MSGRTYVVPISPTRQIIIEGDFPVTLKQWENLHAILDAMKPGLVQSRVRLGHVINPFAVAFALIPSTAPPPLVGRALLEAPPPKADGRAEG